MCSKYIVLSTSPLDQLQELLFANFTYLDYATNIDISDTPPAEYVGRYREKLGEEGYRLACAQNALPENFERLSYPVFLSRRRLLMSQIVKKAYAELNN